MSTTLNSLIDQYNVAGTKAEKLSIKNQIHLRYYSASAAERLSVQVLMKPFLKEIEQEMVDKDPVARQAHELYTRLMSSKVVSR